MDKIKFISSFDLFYLASNSTKNLNLKIILAGFPKYLNKFHSKLFFIFTFNKK